MSESSKTTLRVATRTMEALSRGETWENASWRIHRYNESVVVTDLTNAGKRGKKVESFTLASASYNDKLPWESIALEYVMNANRGENLAKMLSVAEEQKEVFDLDITKNSRRGVDTLPAGFKPIEINGDKVYIKVSLKGFYVKNKEDQNNEPTCIPATEGKQKDLAVFFRWVKDNQDKVENMSFHQVLDAMNKLGIDHHTYCAVD